MAQQSTAASRSLREEAERLAVLIDEFHVARAEGADAVRREAQKSAPPAPAPTHRAAPSAPRSAVVNG
jgi:hypothetical protein